MGVPRRVYLFMYPLLALALIYGAVFAWNHSWTFVLFIAVLGSLWFAACALRAAILYARYWPLIKEKTAVWAAARPLWFHKVRVHKASGTVFYASFSHRRKRMYLWCVQQTDMLKNGGTAFSVPAVCYKFNFFTGEVLRHETTMGILHYGGGVHALVPHKINRRDWTHYTDLSPHQLEEYADRLNTLASRLNASVKAGSKHVVTLPLTASK